MDSIPLAARGSNNGTSRLGLECTGSAFNKHHSGFANRHYRCWRDVLDFASLVLWVADLRLFVIDLELRVGRVFGLLGKSTRRCRLSRICRGVNSVIRLSHCGVVGLRRLLFNFVRRVASDKVGVVNHFGPVRLGLAPLQL